jgi:dipeptidyl aminopeptidase/acylaminoacyl peptidase
MKTEKLFGLWNSPISAQMLGQRARLDDVKWDSDGQTIVWLEGRSDQTQLVAQQNGDARRDLLDGHSPSGGVGYGGGEFTIHGRTILFAERDGRLYRHSLAYTKPETITPPFGAAASPVFSPDGAWVIYVYSDGGTDLLALVDASGREWPVQLARGADFYMQPAWHPDGRKIAWVEWDHPHMPWDGTRIMLAELAGSMPRVQQSACVGGGDTLPASQPIFSPDGRWLAFIEAGEEWDNLVLLDLSDGSRRTFYEGKGEHLCTPAWGQGEHTIGWSHDSMTLYAIRNSHGFANLVRLGLDGTQERIDTTQYTWLWQLSVSPAANEAAFIASSPQTPTRILRWDGTSLQVVARSESETTDPAFLPDPQAVDWLTADGTQVHGLYYPPTHPGIEGRGLPPAIFKIHGGPTSLTPTTYSLENAYYTSRGYAVVEVNYRGSSGYGRGYQDALRGHWGEFDMQDSVTGKQTLDQLGLIDPARCVIKGGSAGGLTVLNALVHHPGTFKAGVCLFGVSNLFTLDMDTHKFEQHYTKGLVGSLPEASDRFHTWSPAFHADQIRDPMIIFQGSADKVVVPNQSEEIVSALRRNGVTHKYIVYEGEGHGFRKSENIVNCLNETERFLMQHVLFAP